MPSLIKAIEDKYKKHDVVDVRSGDSVRVHQKIREGNKERIQIFEGLVIRTDRKSSHTSSIRVRRIASGVGVEKTYLLHSPQVVKVEVVKRSKVRRKYLSYMRERTGKSARLSSVVFDREEVNKISEPEAKTKDDASDGTKETSAQDTPQDKVQNENEIPPNKSEKEPAVKKVSKATADTQNK